MMTKNPTMGDVLAIIRLIVVFVIPWFAGEVFRAARRRIWKH